MTRRALRIFGLCALASGCASAGDIRLPGVLSTTNPARHDGLFAGFGRADITPPVGVPMAGHGFEGFQAEGYRQRLFGRALVLEAADGERVALIVADLPHPSLVLHRRVAERIFAQTGIGADRLVLATTHTHSGPGSHYGASQYNQQAAALPGFDEPLTAFLVEALARSVEDAVADLRPSIAGWGRREVPGATQNRSLRPHLTNPDVGDPTEFEAVDDTLRMLRVDQCAVGWVECQPRGAYSAFAIHGTVLPPASKLLDPDVHGVVERRVERAIETLNPGLALGFRSEALHLFANGVEGDVSPRFSPESRCEATRDLDAGRWIGGPRGAETAERWRWSSVDLTVCLAAARDDANRLGAHIAAAAVELHEEIGLSGRLTKDVEIGRAFRTLDLRTIPELCPPRAGVATFGGTEDHRTRLHRWRLLGLDLGMHEGGSAARSSPSGCHGYKRIGVEPLQGLLVGDLGLPTHAQLAVVRVGDGLLVAVPGEPTTAAGLAIRTAVQREASAGIDYVALIGLANGYLQYIASEPEYALQHYEGGSTLYGPKLAQTLTVEYADLSAALRDGLEVEEVPPLLVGPGPRVSYVPPEDQGPAPGSFARQVTSLTCDDTGLSATWLDLYPGRFRVHEGQVLEIQRRRGDAWERVAWDDSPAVLVRVGRPRGGRGHEWYVEWYPESPPLAGTYRIFLMNRSGLPAVPITGSGLTASCP